MVQKTFAIYTDAALTASSLQLELGSTHLACWTQDEQTQLVQTFELFEFDEDKTDDFAEVFRQVKLYSKLLEASFDTVAVTWENEECLLVPAVYAGRIPAADCLNFAYGYSPGSVVGQRELSNSTALFRFPQSWKQVLEGHFPGAQYNHKFQHMYRSAGNDGARVFFYRGHFLLTLYSNGQLQLVQRFVYQTPEDVVYHILNTFERNGLAAETATVQVSGLIDLRSSLYTELYKYLHNLKVEEAADCIPDTEAFREYPLHYFLPFFKTAA
jgi:hypothetical protein